LLVAGCLFLIYLPTSTSTWSQSPDPVSAALPAWNLVTHGDLSLDAFEHTHAWLMERDGRLVSNRTGGIILYGVPFYWVLGEEAFTFFPARFAAALTAAVAMGLLAVLLRRFLRPSAAALAAVLAGLGTATWSVSADGLWTHTPNQMLLIAAMLLLARGQMWSSGLMFGAAIVVRPHLAVAAAVVGLASAFQHRSLRPAVAVGVPSAAGLVTLMTFNLIVHGRFAIAGGYGTEQVDNVAGQPLMAYAENLAGMFISPDRGLLVLSPFLILLIPGIKRAYAVAPPWVRASAWSGLAYLLVQSRMNYFSGGNNFFSYRLTLETLTLLGPLLALAYREHISGHLNRMRWFLVAAVTSILFQALGVAFFQPPFTDRSAWRPMALIDVIGNAGLLGMLTYLLVASATIYVLFPRQQFARRVNVDV
jgi:hypothetical protein